MNSVYTVAKYLKDNKESLAIMIVDDIVRRLKAEFPTEEKKYYFGVYAEFIDLLSEGITLNENKVPQGFMEMSRRNGERQAALKGRISSIIGRYPDIRLGMIEQISKVTIEHGLSSEDVVKVNKRVNFMLDTTVTETILAFERLTASIIEERQREIEEKRNAINELSAPIVPIQDGIAILPLIGTVDSERVDHILNNVLPDIPRLQVQCLIIDFSGIVTIDAEVARHLFRMYDVLRLLGINVNFTGIRPDLATTAVNCGIDFSSIKTFANVKQAIEDMER
jgi:rsbT co-antagonist protein RsbR